GRGDSPRVSRVADGRGCRGGLGPRRGGRERARSRGNERETAAADRRGTVETNHRGSPSGECGGTMAATPKQAGGATDEAAPREDGRAGRARSGGPPREGETGGGAGR